MNGAVLRLVLSGSRGQWGRLVGITGGVAIGVLLLLSLMAASSALQTRDLRGSQLSPAGEQVVDLRDDTVLVLAGSEWFRERTIERLDIAATAGSTVVVPGTGRAPDPGTSVVSSALAALIAEHPSDELGDRYGTVVGTLPDSVLRGPDALVAVVGVDPAALTDPSAGALTVDAFAPQLFGGSDAYRILAVVGGIALVVPAALLVAIATGLGAAARRERFATLRLIGGAPGLLTALVVVEAAVTAIVGGVIGVALFAAVRPVLATLSLNGSRFFLDDLAISPVTAFGVVLTVVVAACVAAAVSIRRASIGPLGSARAVHERTPHVLRLLPLPLGFAFLAVGVFAADLLPFGADVVLIGSFLVITVGLVVAGPRLTMDASRLLATRARSGAGVMAANRIRRTPSATFRAVSGVVIAVFAMSMFTGASSALVDEDDAAVGIAPTGSVVAWLPLSGEGGDAAEVAAIDSVAGVEGVVVVRSGEEGSYVTREEAALLGADPLPETALVALDAPILPVVLDEAPAETFAAGVDVDVDGLLPTAVVAITDGTADAVERARTAMIATLPASGSSAGPVTPAESSGSLDSDLARDFAALGSAGIVIAAAIAAVSLGVATTAAVLDRRRTIGLLRLIGMPRGALRGVIALESAVPLIAVTALAIVAGYAAAVILIEGLATDRTVAAPGPEFLVAIGSTIAFAAVAVLIAARTADRSTSGTVRFE